MRNRSAFSLLSWFSLAMLMLALTLLIFELIAFSRQWANYPPGLSIAGIPVGQLNRQQAAQRLLEIYTQPVELLYNDSIINLQPSTVDFNLDLESMLAASDQERTRFPFWGAFWDYLWGRNTSPVNIPLLSSYSEARLRVYLANDIATRYDQPPSAALPVPGTVNFEPGSQGTELDVDRSVLLIDSALRSTRLRTVILPLQRTSPPRPTLQNLEILLRQTIIEISQYDGVAGLYLSDLQTGEEISVYLDQGQALSTPPDIAFSASSTIKIPILVSAFRRLGDDPETERPLDETTYEYLEAMITQSNNPSSDWVMSNIVSPEIGPLAVTADLQSLGFENTFLAGYFYQGAPLLRQYLTPSNQRTDVVTDPDLYSQTTPSEIGELLRDIYFCAQTGGGSLVAAFPGEISQAECQTMIQLLKNDRTPWLIPAGVPDGTEVAHKHGWISDPFGIIHDMSDAAIVYTQGRTYVLCVFLYHPDQLVFDPSNKLVVDLSRAIYNFYNLPEN